MEDDDCKCSDIDVFRFLVGWGMVGYFEDIFCYYFIIRIDEYLFFKKRVWVIKRYIDSVVIDER